uniref:R3H domain-containing protein n=1 Tax=Oryctolagus cuniculus TaxID=9986 RepID=A0A5F9C3E3_RABIT
MADLLGSILSSMEKPPSLGDQETRRKAREQAARLKKLQEQDKQQKLEFRRRMEKEVSDFIQDSGQIKKKFQPMNKIERSILHDVVEVAGLTSFSFGEDDDCRYVMIFKKEFAPSDEELDSYRRGEEWDPQKAEEKRRLKELAPTGRIMNSCMASLLPAWEHEVMVPSEVCDVSVEGDPLFCRSSLTHGQGHPQDGIGPKLGWKEGRGEKRVSTSLAGIGVISSPPGKNPQL